MRDMQLSPGRSQIKGASWKQSTAGLMLSANAVERVETRYLAEASRNTREARHDRGTGASTRTRKRANKRKADENPEEAKIVKDPTVTACSCSSTR